MFLLKTGNCLCHANIGGIVEYKDAKVPGLIILVIITPSLLKTVSWRDFTFSAAIFFL